MTVTFAGTFPIQQCYVSARNGTTSLIFSLSVSPMSYRIIYGNFRLSLKYYNVLK